jgi:hypothetical protein
MIAKGFLAAAAAAWVVSAGFSAAAASEPKELVGAFYAEPSVTLGPGRTGGYFARDLDVALRGDASSPGQVGAVDFDYRYGAQDLQVRGLQLIQEVDNDQARVVAVFKNFGRAHSVDWSLCRRANGEWRIADVSSNTGPQDWDLRQLLSLPADRIRC